MKDPRLTVIGGPCDDPFAPNAAVSFLLPFIYLVFY